MADFEESPTARHNRLAADFVQKIVREEVKAGGDFSSILVILESIVVGVMIVNSELFGMTPRKSAGLVEQVIDAAIERYARTQKGKDRG